MRRLGIRIANAVLFVVCCYAVAGLFNEISSSALTPLNESQALAVAEVSGPEPRSATRIRDINRRNLFGSAVQTSAAIELEPEPEPEVVTTLTKLPLKLLGTAAFEFDSSLSRATIVERGSKSSEVLGIGDALDSYPEVIVAGISAGKVILDNDGSAEILQIDDDETEVSGRKPKRSTRSSRRSRDRNSRSSKKSSQRNSSLADNLQKLAEQTSRGGGFSNLLSQTQVLPKYENGKMVGIEFPTVPSGGFLEQIGIENGDVITEVNGVRIDSPTVSQEIMATLDGMPEIFMIKNELPFVVPADKLRELLASGALGQ